MNVRSFFKPVKDFEELSSMVCTIPDMSLSVRDILTRYTRDSIPLPPIDGGTDESYEDFVNRDFSDSVSAYSVLKNSCTLLHDLEKNPSDSSDHVAESSSNSDSSHQ